VRDQDGAVHLAVHDDGVGGARPVRGSGLIGLRDRVEALGGLLVVRSAPGDGTLVMATLPPQPS
jgi:signal transduction histidine kinase